MAIFENMDKTIVPNLALNPNTTLLLGALSSGSGFHKFDLLSLFISAGILKYFPGSAYNPILLIQSLHDNSALLFLQICIKYLSPMHIPILYAYILAFVVRH